MFQLALFLLLTLVSAFLVVVVPFQVFVCAARATRRNEDRSFSLVPLVGSIAGAIAVLIAPVGDVRNRWPWALAPLGVEVIIVLTLTALWHITGLARRSRELRREHHRL